MEKVVIEKYLVDNGEVFDHLIEADLNNFTSTNYAAIKKGSPTFKLIEIETVKKASTSNDVKGKEEKITNHKILKTFDLSNVVSADLDKFLMSKVYRFDNGDVIRVNQNNEIFEDYLKQLNIKFNELERPWYKKIVGFRSGTPWKMILSSLTILTLLFFTLTVLPSAISGILIPLLGIASFAGILYYIFRGAKNLKNKKNNKNIALPFFMSLALFFLAMSVSEADESTNSKSDSNDKDNAKQTLVATPAVKKTSEKEDVTTEEVTTEKPTTEKPTTEKPTTEKPEKASIDKNKIGTVARFPAEFTRHIDGDTSVLNIDGQDKKVRYLLIDTPETKHPRTGVQPFGPEASARTEELLTNASKIEVEYDVGEKTDKYDRDLVYVYVDGKMINEILVREGLASVSFVYPPNTRYLDTLKNAETLAKSEKLGIWSLDSAFENDDSNQNVNANETTQNTEPNQNNQYSNFVQQQPSNTIQSFANCTELRQVYPEGVPSTHPAYTSKMDRDGDNFACEAS
ncbi:thermonuclease family protein [Macrococcus armenti]|uniref:thermonuclease family protein n=1 Tax=Macrococcus armenti TaxID=2875764 RepID=UPI001CCEB89E|nr:thermonuclease family protein [Macrococcus armenti]UBH14107.1 thermonuclease family protein [Macrococcus armenti]